MFMSPRFVVVDDRPDHLKAILRVFHELRSPCLGVVYDGTQDLDMRAFENVRVLFLDLHLSDSTATTDETRHYSVIAGILEDNISPEGGPYILVIWTEYEESAANLVEYLDASLDQEKPYARPLAVTSLPKGRFINVETGEIQPDSAEELRSAVERTVSQTPQFAALATWEVQIQGAVGATLSTMMELVPEDQRNVASIAVGLNEILTRLAKGAVGRSNVAKDPRAAVAGALTPILADRLINQQQSDADLEIWAKALTWSGGEPLDEERVGKVNRMLHAEVNSSGTINSTDWGAVVEFPDDWWNDDDALRDWFGVSRKQLLGGEFKIGTADRSHVRPRLVRIGAACDYAQNRAGPVPYLFGLEIPCQIQRKPDGTGSVRLPASEWRSPVLSLDAGSGPFVLAVNSRYGVNMPSAGADNWNSCYRIREQLLMHLISHASNHLARPGILQL